MVKSSSASSRTAKAKTKTLTRKKSPKTPTNTRKATPKLRFHKARQQSEADDIDEYERAARAYPSPQSAGKTRHRVLPVGKRSSEVYHADSEAGSGAHRRRFSHIYGHGHSLDDLPKQSQPKAAARQAGTKRKAPDAPSASSAKKVRFANNIQNSPAAPRKEVPLSPWESNDPRVRIDDSFCEDQGMKSSAYSNLAKQISVSPSKLNLSQITGLFLTLQEDVHGFAHNWFGPHLHCNATEVKDNVWNFPIQDLEMHYPALYLTTMNVLDASTTDGVYDGWCKFFADPEYRPFLVSAVLGEWFTQRIFKVSSFGMPPEVQKRMQEEVEEPYLWYEGFVRAKRRADIVMDEFTPEDMPWAYEHLRVTALELADEILTMLRPVLDFSNGPFDNQEETLRVSLVNLIERCAYFNWSIIRSGEDGTMIRCADRLENGKQFWPTAPMRCVNEAMVNETRNDSELGKDERLVIKMTCWGRVEALVPHGLDQVELSERQRELTQDHIRRSVNSMKDHKRNVDKDSLDKSYNDFCWDCGDITKIWDVLPEELRPAEKRRREKAEMLHRNNDLRLRLEIKAEKEALRNEKSHPLDSSSSNANSQSDCNLWIDSDEDMSDLNMESDFTERDKYETPLRGAWLEYYKCLTPHRVYCEWAKPEAAYAAELQKLGYADAKDISIRRRNGLSAMVKAARADLPFFQKIAVKEEDILLELWNIYADHNLKIEWSAFLVAIIYGLYRGGGLGIFKQAGILVPNLILAARRIIGKGMEYCGAFLMRDVEEAYENLTAAGIELKDYLVWFLAQLRSAQSVMAEGVSNIALKPNISGLRHAASSANADVQTSLKSFFEYLPGAWDGMTSEARTEATSIATAISAIAASSLSPNAVGSQATGLFSPLRWWRGSDNEQELEDSSPINPLLSSDGVTALSHGGTKFLKTSVTVAPTTSKSSSARFSKTTSRAITEGASSWSYIAPSYTAKSRISKAKTSVASVTSHVADRIKQAVDEQAKSAQPAVKSADLKLECEKWPCTLNVVVNKKKKSVEVSR